LDAGDVALLRGRKLLTFTRHHLRGAAQQAAENRPEELDAGNTDARKDEAKSHTLNDFSLPALFFFCV